MTRENLLLAFSEGASSALCSLFRYEQVRVTLNLISV